MTTSPSNPNSGQSTGDTLDLEELDGEVSIYRDEWDIPHVRAQSTHDVFFAQGYVHAQDRLWQMDAARRRMEGRWSEWVGGSGVGDDTLARRLGASAACQRDAEALSTETKDMLVAYSAGVNARIMELTELPLEYRLLEVEPEPWLPWHSIAAMRQRGYLMGSVWFKLWRAAALRAIGPDQISKLRYDDDNGDLLCIPPGADSDRWIATLQDLSPAIQALAVLGAPDATGGGSNNWAVSGSRTESGRPLLAGDPHRAFDMPAMYTQAHLACDDFDVIGLTVPGVPAFPHFAHNGSVAWCVTHAFADIHDLYVEQLSPDSTKYLFNDDWLDTKVRHEQILVRDGEPVDVEIVETHHGPVVAGNPGSDAALTLRSVQFAETDLSFDCLLPMLRSKTSEDLFAASRGWGLIDHNVLAADTAGNIAHLVRAVVPRRPRLAGWLPVPGWTGEYDWDGNVPWESMPRTFNPERGYLATANNRFVGDTPDGPYLCTDCHPPYRARRVESRLADLPQATVADMQSIHSDVISLSAPVFQRAVANVTDAPDFSEVRQLIIDWDAKMSTDSVAAAAYTTFRWALTRLVAARSGLGEVGKDPITDLPPGIDPVNHLWWTLPGLVRADDAGLLNGATWSEVVAEALQITAANHDGGTWSTHHRALLMHPLAAQFPEHASVLGPQGATLGGDNDTVLATGCVAAAGSAAVYGAVARYIFDVGNWDNCSWIVASGASGEPGDPHYLDQHDAWAKCELVPMHYNWTTIEAVSSRVVFRPVTPPRVE